MLLFGNIFSVWMKKKGFSVCMVGQAETVNFGENHDI